MKIDGKVGHGFGERSPSFISCTLAELRNCATPQGDQEELDAALLTGSVFPRFQEHDKREPVEERSYRQSRLCRVFGNPVAFTIAQLLLENGEMSPSEIARAVSRSLSRVSHTLAALRLADVVRYDSDRNMRARYRLKHPREIRQVIRALSSFVDSVSSKPKMRFT
jgi:DNA-binding transcriptional ArsR family regulator